MSPVSNPPTVPVSLTPPFCRWFFPRVKQRTKRSKRTTKQMTKAININNSRTRGPNCRLHEINFSWWDDIAKIESFQHFHHLKRKNTFYATLFFFTIFVNSLPFFSYFLQGKNDRGNRKIWQTLRILQNYAKIYCYVIPRRACSA